MILPSHQSKQAFVSVVSSGYAQPSSVWQILLAMTDGRFLIIPALRGFFWLCTSVLRYVT